MLASYEVRTSIAAWDQKWVRQSFIIARGCLLGWELTKTLIQALCHVQIRTQI
jgi:hypothetical protein